MKAKKLTARDVLRVMLENQAHVFEICLFENWQGKAISNAFALPSFTIAGTRKMIVKERAEFPPFDYVPILRDSSTFNLLAYIKKDGKLIAQRKDKDSPLVALDDTLFTQNAYSQFVEDDLYQSHTGREINVAPLTESSAGSIMNAFFKWREAEKEK
jgi:hypothetical protein